MPPAPDSLPVITGLGFICSLGNDAASVARRLRHLEHGLAPFDYVPGQDCPVKVAGVIRDFDVASTNCLAWRWPEAYPIAREALRGLAPHGVYATCALQQAAASAGLEPAALSDPRTGLFCASAGSPRMMLGNLGNGGPALRRANPMGVVHSISGTLNFNLGAAFRILGANCGFVSACASSSHALGYACDEIRLGRQDRMIVIGAEDLNAESMLPFMGMRALSQNPDPDTASRPFDRQRDGFVGTGGAVCLIVESAALAARRGARVFARIRGWGQASDGHNIMISHPEGDGLHRAMELALADAGVTPEAIGYVNAHATSTPIGDLSEARALHRLFGHRADGGPWVSSTKALTGHALSMAGALEAGLCALALHHGFTPGCAHLREPDPALPPLRLPRTTLDAPPGLVLHNASGFGGCNVALVLERG